MLNETSIWGIFFLPLISFFTIALIIRPFFNSYSVLSGPIAILGIGASFIISLLTFVETIIKGNVIPVSEPLEWLTIGSFQFTVGILLNPLTTIMLVIVTGVSLMVQIYSIGYMKSPQNNHEAEPHGSSIPIRELGQPVYARYFSYMSLFTVAMIGLIMAANIVQMFVFWELVGLCSYLLIGFWFHRPAAATAAKKAFIVTRVGDLGFLIAMIYLFSKAHLFPETANPLHIEDINQYLPTLVSGGAITLITLGIFIGAVGKSGQFPLHTWLPDAMEGPTPVSALIHAATMVAAGIFLVGRFFPIFLASDYTMTVVCLTGAVTAVFAASMGLVSNDIKRVLAYSTVSQLGYMMLAMGVGAYGPAIFHLFTHAFFKALLFLGSGSVNHATGTFDMRFMGGLRKHLPITYFTFLIGGLSLAGIFPLAGFWSKDEILTNSLASGGILGMFISLLALLGIFMTAFYMFRALLLTFGGTFRGGSDKDPSAISHGPVHLADPPIYMILPMILLAILAIISGFFANPLFGFLGIPAHWMSHSLDASLPLGLHGHIEGADFSFTIALVSSAIALGGIILAILMYKTNPVIYPETVGRTFRPIHILLSKKYYLDELYEDLITTKLYYARIANISDWLDRNIVDSTVNVVGWLGANIGGALRQLQNGQTQMYATATSLGIIIISIIFIFLD